MDIGTIESVIKDLETLKTEINDDVSTVKRTKLELVDTIISMLRKRETDYAKQMATYYGYHP